MARIPNGRYTKEFREEAVKMVTEASRRLVMESLFRAVAKKRPPAGLLSTILTGAVSIVPASTAKC